MFEEALKDKYAEKLLNTYSNSLFVRYRRDKAYKNYKNTYKNPQKCLELIEDLFCNLKVDLKLIELTPEEIEQILTIFLAKVNNTKLSENQFTFINNLLKATSRAKDRKKREDKIKELKSFRAFLKNQRISLVSSSRENNEFLQIRLIRNAILGNEPLDGAQKEFLKMLKKRTQDCKNKEYKDNEVKSLKLQNNRIRISQSNSNKSTSKQKSDLYHQKLLSGKKNMIKKDKKSKEQYQVELENRYPKENYRKEMLDSMAEGRAEFLRQVKSCTEQSCSYCSSHRDHFVPIEYSTEEFTYESIEDVVAEVICPDPDVISSSNTLKTEELVEVVREKSNSVNIL